MRDLNRIYKFCNEFDVLWGMHPDLRFGQLVEIVFSRIKADGKEPFFIEEDEMIKYFKEYLNKNEYRC